MMQSDFVVGLFYGPMRIRRGAGGTTMREVDDNVRTKQVVTAFLVAVHFLLSVLSLFISLVPGAALGGGPGGVTFAALPRTVWQIPVLVVCFFACLSLYFDSNSNVASTVTWVAVFMWFLSIVAVINIVSAISLALELNNPGSALWLENSGAWTAVLLAGTIFFIGWELLCVHRFYTFHSDLTAAFAFGWRPGKVATPDDSDMGADEPLIPDKEYEEPPAPPASAASNPTATAPPAPQGVAANNRISTGFTLSSISVHGKKKTK